MELGSKNPLITFFTQEMVQPITQILETSYPLASEKMRILVETKIKELREDLIQELKKAFTVIENMEDRVTESVTDTVNYLLETVEKKTIQNKIKIKSPPVLQESEIPETPEETHSTPCSPSSGPTKIAQFLSDEEISKSQSLATDSTNKDTTIRKKMKRSLEDTVQKLNNDIWKTSKTSENSFMLPQTENYFSNSSLQRWFGVPYQNSIFVNTPNIFPAFEVNNGQLETFLKMNSFPTILKNNLEVEEQPSQTDSDIEDVKMDCEVDYGDAELSDFASSGDTTETESSSSTMATLSSADPAEKPFVCMHNNCGKKFGNKFLLKKHMFIHTGLRPHTCPYCHKRFNRKDNLLRHKKTHAQNGHNKQNQQKLCFSGLSQLPALHNISLPGLKHFQSLKVCFDSSIPTVRSLS